MDFLNCDAESLIESASSSELPYGTKASNVFEVLKEYIEDFQDTLDSEHEVGILQTSFGQNNLLKVTHVTYENPSILIFKGIMGEEEVTLIQHINQLNFLLTSVEKEPNRPKQQIGFTFAPNEEE